MEAKRVHTTFLQRTPRFVVGVAPQLVSLQPAQVPIMANLTMEPEKRGRWQHFHLSLQVAETKGQSEGLWVLLMVPRKVQWQDQWERPSFVSPLHSPSQAQKVPSSSLIQPYPYIHLPSIDPMQIVSVLAMKCFAIADCSVGALGVSIDSPKSVFAGRQGNIVFWYGKPECAQKCASIIHALCDATECY